MSQQSPEYINGRMQPVTSSFRNFSSPEEYARYKVKLLNNSRYKAFSGSVSEFAERVKRGGYATDPDYVAKLNNIIKYAKSGTRLTPDPEVEAAKKEYIDMITKRVGILEGNANRFTRFPVFTNMGQRELRKESRRVDTIPMYIDPYISSDGYYT